jgi:hypothetical protein
VRYADDFVAMAKQMGSETIEFMETAGREVPMGDQPGKDAGGGLEGRRSEPELSGIHVSV